MTLSHLAYLIVLAEDASKVAAGKEDGAGSMTADQRGLLPKMRGIAVNASVSAHTAESSLVFKAVHPAVSGADFTTGQAIDGLTGSILQNLFGKTIVACH
ncbi:MAG: hypothetical protein ACE14P_03360 [Methanotrichaceae archaeon]